MFGLKTPLHDTIFGGIFRFRNIFGSDNLLSDPNASSNIKLKETIDGNDPYHIKHANLSLPLSFHSRV